MRANNYAKAGEADRIWPELQPVDDFGNYGHPQNDDELINVWLENIAEERHDDIDQMLDYCVKQ